MVETNTPTQDEKKPAKKLHAAGQKIRHGLEYIHKKIGVYGWVALALLIILFGTVMHYESRDKNVWKFHPPLYIHQRSDWIRDIDRDFQTMQRQMDVMRARHERIMRDAWETSIDPKTTTTSIVSNGDFQYSVNTKNGQLDGFISASAENIQKLLPQIQKLGLTVEQKDNRLFLSGDAKVANELIQLLK